MLKHYSGFLSAKFDNVSSTSFVYTLDQKKIFPSQTVLRHWHSSLEPQINWISPWLGWKAIYVETLYSDILIAKLENLFSTFFVYHLGPQLFSSHTVLGQWHSSLDPRLIWISPRLGWNAIYVETLYSEFLSAKFDNLSSTFFVHHAGQKFSASQTVLKQWHSSLDPQFIWISPWLGWKAVYVETLYSEFLSGKFNNLFSTFFVYHLGQQLISSHTTRAMTLLPRFSNHSKNSLTRLKCKLCWNTISSFWARNLTTYRVLFRIHLRSKILSLPDCTWAVTLVPRPSINLNKSLTRLKSNLCWNTVASFWARHLTTYSVIIRIPSRSTIIFLSHCTRAVTLLPRLSNHLKMSLTRLKGSLCWNTVASFWARHLTTYSVIFRIPTRPKIFSFSDCTPTVTLFPRPSIHLNVSLTRLKSNLCWNTI